MIKTFRKSDLRLTYGILMWGTVQLIWKNKKAKILLFYNIKNWMNFAFHPNL